MNNQRSRATKASFKLQRELHPQNHCQEIHERIEPMPYFRLWIRIRFTLSTERKDRRLLLQKDV